MHSLLKFGFLYLFDTSITLCISSILFLICSLMCVKLTGMGFTFCFLSKLSITEESTETLMINKIITTSFKFISIPVFTQYCFFLKSKLIGNYKLKLKIVSNVNGNQRYLLGSIILNVILSFVIEFLTLFLSFWIIAFHLISEIKFKKNLMRR